LIGLDYQHHHVPAWAPPPWWRHETVRSGRQGADVDCSNFLTLVFSYVLGVEIPAGIRIRPYRRAGWYRPFAHRVVTHGAGARDAGAARRTPTHKRDPRT